MQTTIKPPFFEIGPKAYLWGEEALTLALAAEAASNEFDVDVIFTPQLSDIHLIAEHTKRLIICAQKIDPIPVGRGQGSVLVEAVKAAGARAVMLNHAECPCTLSQLRAGILRAREAGLISVICADSIAEASAAACLDPDVIVAEPTELIGSGIASDEQYVEVSTLAVKRINPDILVLQGAGISGPEDVYRVILAGADATGSSSAVCKASDRTKMAREMIQAARRAYDDRVNQAVSKTSY
ncbi:triose-phosphate isomerase [Clostridia bacterium]|nr:triose-phosphate isomerase [Clostridia bacterium]